MSALDGQIGSRYCWNITGQFSVGGFMAKKSEEWWHEFFPDFRPMFANIEKGATANEVRYLVRKLGLKSGVSFLDCPCGYGRISVPLAKKGVRVTGVDITPSYVQELEQKADRLKLPIRALRGDMRRIQFRNEFDAAGNLWTSFGYFEKEPDNLAVLKRMYRALKPGGKFMLHLINRDWVMAHYTTHSWQEVGGLKALEERHFEYRTSINRCVWTFIRGNQEVKRRVDLRMYSFHEIIAMFESIGFTSIEGFGSSKDEPISRDRMMMFVIGTKPGRGHSLSRL
jgi:SAM-dependent methyltransferase